MTPEQFEHHVASIYSKMGYATTVSPLSNDWGIDVIAVNGEERIAIQAKMYGATSRHVNRRVVMELYGAAAYQDCTSAVIATDGSVLPDAKRVADKLGIKIMTVSPHIGLAGYSFVPSTDCIDAKSQKMPIVKSDGEGYPSFDTIWEEYIMPLKGRTISNGTRSNTIIDVTWAGLKRKTSKGNIGKIDIEHFRFAYNTLVSKGQITRDYINQQVDKRCSSGIVLVLGQVPFISITSNPICLIINGIESL